MVLETPKPFNRYFVRPASGVMLCLKVLLGAHFLKPRYRPLELKSKPRAHIQRLGRLGRRCDEFDVAVIELIHQIDEAPRRVLPIFPDNRDILDEHSVVLAGDLDVI